LENILNNPSVKIGLILSLMFLVVVNAQVSATLNSIPAFPANIDVGQNVIFTANILGTTATPYTYNFLIYNSITGAVVANQLYTGVSSTSNTFVWLPLAPNSLLEANVIISDSGTNTVNSIMLTGLNVNPSLEVFPINISSQESASNSIPNMANVILDSGESAYVNLLWSGGTPPYTAKTYTSNSLSCSSSSTLLNTSTTSNTFLHLKVSPTATTSYCYTVTDSAANPVTGSNTPQPAKIVVNPALASVIVSSSSSNINSGEQVTLNASWTGGTPPFAAYLYESGTSQCGSTFKLLQKKSGISSNTVSFNAIPSSSGYYCVSVSDSAVDPSVAYIINSTKLNEPSGIALSRSGGNLYVANYYNHLTVLSNVTIINISTKAAVGVVSDPFAPTANVFHPNGVEFSPSGAYAYISNSGGSNIFIMNTSTNTIIRSINESVINGTFPFPESTAFNNAGTYAYEANYGNSTVSIINTSANTITHTIFGGLLSSPFSIKIAPSGAYAYVSNLGSSNVVVLNTSSNTITASLLAVFNSPRGIVFSPSGAYAYIPNNNAGISVINTTTRANYTYLSATSYTLSGPNGIALSPSGKTAYVTYGTNNIMVLNTGIKSNETASSVHVQVNSPPAPSSAPQIYDVKINDSVSNASSSNVPVVTAYLLSSSGKLISTNQYMQNQMPAIISITSPEYVVFSFACSFTSGGMSYSFADNVYGIGMTNGCGSNYTLVGGTRTIIYSETAKTENVTKTSNVTVTVTKEKPTLEFVKECSNFQYNASISNTCSTEAEISTPENQLKAQLYLNNLLVGNTSTIITDNVSLPGNYTFRFATQGNGNYTNASISYTFAITAPINISKQRNSTPPQPHVLTINLHNQAYASLNNLSVSSNTTLEINSTNEKAFIRISSENQSGPFSLKIINATNISAATPAGMKVISAINITLNSNSSNSMTLNMTMGYSCNNGFKSVSPYILKNSVWTPITNYHINNSTCQISFEIPSDPVVGLLAVLPSHTVNNPSGSVVLWVVILVVIIIILAIIYLLKRPQRRKFK
jgi:YVTN family beta-propeller protein